MCISIYMNRHGIPCHLFSVLAGFFSLLFMLSCIGTAYTGQYMGHSLGKRPFLMLGCNGTYDASKFARLDRLCEDCYNLFREPQVDGLCRQNCFTTNWTGACVDVLQLQDEKKLIQSYVRDLNGYYI